VHRSSTSPEEFLVSLPDGVREDMTELDAALAAVFAGHERVLWEGPMWGGTYQRIIGYGALSQPRPSGESVDWFVVGLAAQKAHLSLYVSAVENGRYLVRRYADRLGKAKVGSANVTFRRLAAIDLPTLVEMAARARDLVLGGI
jgi:hypothetical protein